MKYLFVGCVLVLSTACNVRETDILTQPTRAVSVTVRALVFESTDPIADATVYVNNQSAGVTGGDGRVSIHVTAGAESTISVRKDGWDSVLPWAAGVVNSDGETWTFYMQRANMPAK